MEGSRSNRASSGVARLALAALTALAACSSCSSPPPSECCLRDGLELRQVADDAVLHGDALGRSRVMALPAGGFLLFMSEDVPNGGHLLRSDDGTSWATLGDAESPPLPRIRDVAATLETVVAIGENLPLDGGPDPASIHAVTSRDGRTWHEVADSASLREALAGVLIADASGFAAMGGAPDTLAVAGPAGEQWTTTRPLPGLDSISGVAPADPGFVVWGTANARRPVAWHLDAAGVQVPIGLGAIEPLEIAWFGARGVVTGWAPTSDTTGDEPPISGIETTDRGATWSAIPVDLASASAVQAVGAGGLILVVVTPADNRRDVEVLRPIADIGWQEVTFEPPGIEAGAAFVESVAVDGKRVVVVGNTVETGGGGDRVVVWTGDLP